MRRAGLALCAAALVAVIGLGDPASAAAPPGTTGQYTYTPQSGGRGTTISSQAKCLFAGSGEGVVYTFTVVYKVKGSDGSAYRFGDDAVASADGVANVSVTVPSDAYVGDYFATGACRKGSDNFFFKSGPFTVTGSGAPNQAPPPAGGSTATTAVRPQTQPRAVTTTVVTTASGGARAGSGSAGSGSAQATGRGTPTTAVSAIGEDTETTLAGSPTQSMEVEVTDQPADWKTRGGIAAVAVGLGAVLYALRKSSRDGMLSE